MLRVFPSAHVGAASIRPPHLGRRIISQPTSKSPDWYFRALLPWFCSHCISQKCESGLLWSRCCLIRRLIRLPLSWPPSFSLDCCLFCLTLCDPSVHFCAFPAVAVKGSLPLPMPVLLGWFRTPLLNPTSGFLLLTSWLIRGRRYWLEHLTSSQVVCSVW